MNNITVPALRALQVAVAMGIRAHPAITEPFRTETYHSLLRGEVVRQKNLAESLVGDCFANCYGQLRLPPDRYWDFATKMFDCDVPVPTCYGSSHESH